MNERQKLVKQLRVAAKAWALLTTGGYKAIYRDSIYSYLVFLSENPQITLPGGGQAPWKETVRRQAPEIARLRRLMLAAAAARRVQMGGKGE